VVASALGRSDRQRQKRMFGETTEPRLTSPPTGHPEPGTSIALSSHERAPIAAEACVWHDAAVVKYRRAIAVAIGSLGLVCAALALVDTFDLYDVPGGGFFRILTWPLIFASWLFLDISSQWRTPKVSRTER
jgi:hypothetical protein